MGCELVIIKDGDKTSTAFICGRKTHECDSDGPGVMLLRDGSEVEWTPENEAKYRDTIVGGSVSCSVCGTSAISQAPWL